MFKVVTNLNYKFKFGITEFDDNYQDAEFLLTGNLANYKTIKHTTQEMVTKIITEDEKIKNIKIYSSDKDEQAKLVNNYDYIGKKMDWDFSNPAVRNEVKAIQLKNIENMSKNSALEDLEFKSENFELEIDSANYMKFDNYKINLGRKFGDSILINKNTDNIKNRSEALETITRQFKFGGEKTLAVDDWNGWEINKVFIQKVKKDSENGEGNNPKIKDLSKYYGWDGNTESDEGNMLLVGYGESTLRKASYAGMRLAKMTINTVLNASYTNGMEDLYDDLKSYVGTVVDALQHNIKIWNSDHTNYFFQWKFADVAEWKLIQDEMAKPENSGTVTFNWIMENVLLNKRILYNKLTFPLPVDAVPKESQSFLNSVIEIKYVQPEGKNYLIVDKESVYKSKLLRLKYGPFMVNLTDYDHMSVWQSWAEAAEKNEVEKAWMVIAGPGEPEWR